MSTLGISDPTIPNEKNSAYVKSRKISMLIDHEKNALCDGYILLNSFMMLLKIIMREEYMLVGVAIISSFLSICLSFEVILVLPSYAN